MNTSETLKTLLPALAKAKQAFAPALKTAVNPHFKSKYVDLASVVDATEEALSTNGLMLLQGAEGSIDSRSVTISTRLFHVSGEWIESGLTLPAGTETRFDAQTVGSAITYGRRYSYMAILGIAPEDDDGSLSSGNGGRAMVQQARKPQPRSDADDSQYIADDDLPPEVYDEPRQVVAKPSGPVISEAQAKRAFAIAKGSGKNQQQIDAILRNFGYQKTIEVTRQDYEAVCAELGAR